MACFCIGSKRLQMTDQHNVVKWVNDCWICLLAYVRQCIFVPQINKHFDVADCLSYYAFLISLISQFYRLLFVLIVLFILTELLFTLLLVSLVSLALTIALNFSIVNSFLINPHDLPTLYAVSILSPVNIHTFILALSKSLIVYGTSFCKSS